MLHDPKILILAIPFLVAGILIAAYKTILAGSRLEQFLREGRDESEL
jgi:hypothetical protein